MKTIIKLLIALIVLNAAARTGLAAARYYRLKDAAEQVIVFGGSLRIAQLRDEIMARARELEVALDPANVTVRRDGARTVAEASYTESIEVFPNYKYPFTFTFDVEARGLTPYKAEDEPRR